MSCPYCRGKRVLFCNLDKDGGWVAFIRPGDGSMTAQFFGGPQQGFARGELLLDIEYCPMCGTPMIYVEEE